MNYESVYSNIRSTAERGTIYAAIEVLVDALYKKEADIGRLIETEMPSAVVQPLKKALASLPVTSATAVQEYLEGLREELSMLEVLSLEIAFDPTEETMAVLTAWIREHIGARVIMELSVDRGLFGGARVSYEGQYKEINLAMLIESIMRQQQESIHGLLEQIAV